MGGQSPWTDVIITALIQLWSEGRSGAEIARRLNVSRNSVIGKAPRAADHHPVSGPDQGLPRTPDSIGRTTGQRRVGARRKRCGRKRLIGADQLRGWHTARRPGAAAVGGRQPLLQLISVRANKTITGEVEYSRWRRRPAEWSIVANIRPQSAGDRLAFGTPW